MLEKLYSFRLYVQTKTVVVLTAVSVLLNLLTWGWILFQIRPVEEPIFVSYNILFGVDKIGAWWHLYYIPIFGVGVLLINFLFGWISFRKDPYFAYLALLIATLVQLYLFFSAWILVYLNV